MVEFTTLGETDLRVSRIALGLGFRGQSSASAAQRLIEHAIDQGVNFIDCANKYRLRTGAADAHGRSEEILGRVLAGKRDELIITSKVGSDVGPGPEDCGGSRGHIMQQIERSLTQLKTDYIDLYLLHIPDPDTPLDETLRALDDLVRDGKVRHIGCCNHEASQVTDALSWSAQHAASSFVCLQNNYSLLNRAPERELFALARERNLGFMAFSPLAVGLLSGLFTPGEAPPAGSLWAERREEFDNVFHGDAAAVFHTARRAAEARGVSLPQLAVNWVLARDEVSVAITGSDTVEQLDDNLGALGWRLSDEELEALNQRRVELTIW